MAEARVGLTWHMVEDVAVVRVKMSVGASALDRESAVQKLGEIVDQARGKIVLDLEGVELIDSRMLAAIVSLNRKLEGDGGQLRLCRVAPLVRSMLDTFGLLKILHLDETPEASVAALESLDGESPPSS